MNLNLFNGLIKFIDELIREEKWSSIRYYTNAACQHINEEPDQCLIWLTRTYAYRHINDLDWNMNKLLAEITWNGSKSFFEEIDY